MEIRNLVIAPHGDDEVLGCSSILDKGTFVYFCGIAGFNGDLRENRLEEVEKVAKFFNFEYEINHSANVNHLDEHELIGLFEKLINRIKPEKVFIPYPSYNQDHRAVYNAAIIALRPHDKNFFVKKILVYEQEHPPIWEPKPYRVNYFIPLDIEKKIAGYKLYTSQVRGMRSPELLKALAKVRGCSVNQECAEAFIVERWLE